MTLQRVQDEQGEHGWTWGCTESRASFCLLFTVSHSTGAQSISQASGNRPVTPFLQDRGLCEAQNSKAQPQRHRLHVMESSRAQLGGNN